MAVWLLRHNIIVSVEVAVYKEGLETPFVHQSTAGDW
jgi:hypothetical protein